MQSKRWTGVGISLALGSLLAAACTEQPPTAPAGNRPSLAAASTQPGTLQVVALKGGEKPSFGQAVAALGGTIERRHPQIGLVAVSGLSPSGVAAIQARSDVARIDQDMFVQWIPDVSQIRIESAGGVSGPGSQGTNQGSAFFFGFQWNIRQVQAPAAWAATPTGAGETVCVLDTGIDPDHVDLQGRIDLSRSVSMISSPLFPGDLQIIDYNFHGSFVSGLIASNGLGMASVGPDITLCEVKVLRVTGSGSFADVIAGIMYAAEHHADVINMSLGAYVDKRVPGVEGLVTALQKAVDFATRNGVLVVVSAGNSGIDLDEDPPYLVELPAQLHNVVSVGATAPVNQQNFDLLASYSNFGGRTGIDLVAPGGDLVAGGQIFDLVLSVCSQYQLTLPFTCSATDFLFGAGTSFSSPHVAGAAAVVESALGSLSPGALRKCLLQNTDAVGPFRIFGAGRLNVAKAAACTAI